MTYDSRPGAPGGGQGAVVHVTLPRLDPKPVPGCPRCTGAAARRSMYRRTGDLSGVSDCNVVIRRHPHA
ncbi:hypothetical protein GCM10010425_49060 [Streptomyces spororaveus]|uniref:Uncharacterized protein n=1 Tax=Streptomyces spororaveus TaxID=284039 RepID=A0ABQ3T286_9ACTN|nr:hypothetical protein [Streptomyces spororaveus]GHI74500.1 hypothetical protein Sspor_00610 [Streptomyces spororaveus]